MRQRDRRALDKLIPISDYPKSGFIASAPSGAIAHADQGAGRLQRPLRGDMIRSRVFAIALGCTSVPLVVAQDALASSSFIQTYIDARGGCARSAEALAFVLTGQDRQAPFGKPGADWSDDDLASLKTAMADCEAAAAARGNPYHLTDIQNATAELLTKVPSIVKQARADREAQIRQLEARRAIARSRTEEASRRKQTAKASAETEVSRLETEAARAEADARQAIALANRRIDQASRAAGDTKASAANDLARLRERSPGQRSSAGSGRNTGAPSRGEDLAAREGPPGQLRELQADIRSAKTNASFVGCKGAEQLATASQAMLAKDMAAVDGLVTTGQCFVIDSGTAVRVMVTDAKGSSKAACVGIDGHPGCLWLPSNILKFDE